MKHDEQPTNPTRTRSLTAVLDAEVSRRTALRGGALGAAGFIAGSGVAGSTAGAEGTAVVGNFEAIPTNSNDELTLPKGYLGQVIVPWGDPIVPSGPDFVQDASNTADEQEQQLGQGHDGIKYFPIAGSSTHGLLVINHEYTIVGQLHTDGEANWTDEKTRKEQAAHGVSVVEIEMAVDGTWSTAESQFARRIHANTPCGMTGPAVGHRLLRTQADPTGAEPVGTWNNCGNGYTPWNTFLTTEENFNGYFWDETLGSADGISEEQAAINARYGIEGEGFGFQWAKTDERFRADLHPNEPNRFGWIVEIDPFDPTSPPVKHTALGRFKHEGAAFTTAKNGAAVIYMGDDQEFDYLYKFVGAAAWEKEIAAGRNPLGAGTLYVARFDERGSGVWLALVQGQNGLDADAGFADQGDVLIKARLASDIVGATPMDRPEWTAVHPRTGEAYVACSNNLSRRDTNAANPRRQNLFGHIIKWSEEGDDAGADTFTWDFFLLAGAGNDSDGSTIDPDDMFGGPDGLWIDENERMWIQTDGFQPDGSNNQMLLADPNSGAMKRFLVGPVDCEVTGATNTPDGKTVFVNIQHPGDSGGPDNPTETSTWPDGPSAGRPRPATVAIRRADGGLVGGDFENVAQGGLRRAAPIVAVVTTIVAGLGLVRSLRNRREKAPSSTSTDERT